jgi:hypothetical protein
MFAKAQHYVPQSYLRRFSPQEKLGAIYCFNKQNERVFFSNTRNIANEIGFYNITKDVSIDPLLSHIEYLGDQAISEIIQKKSADAINDEIKHHLAVCLGLQMTRTPETELVSDQMEQGLSKHFESFGRIRRILSSYRSRKIHLSRMMIAGINDFSRMLLIHKWALFQNTSKIPYWTSDNPVCKHNETPASFYGNLGLLSPGIQIIFPLSPKFLLFIFDSRQYREVNSHEFADEENVIYYNSCQVFNSIKQIYAPDDNFDLANRILTDHPEYQDPLRQRVVTS